MYRALSHPFTYFTDLEGGPLENGFVYFGEANKNPEVDKIVVYWDETGLLPVSQPARTINGYLSNNGSPANIYCNTDFSLTVRDKNKRIVYTSPSAADSSLALQEDLAATAGAEMIGFGYQTVESKLSELPSPQDYGASGSGLSSDVAPLTSFFQNDGVRIVPPGTYLLDAAITNTYRPKGVTLVDGSAVYSDQMKLPSCLNNANHKIKDSYIYQEYTGGTAAYGDVPLSVEAYAKPGSVGNVCGLFASVRGESAADIWGFNTVTRTAPGFTGIAQGYEVDVDNLSGSTPSEVYGVNVTGVGDLSGVVSAAFVAARAGLGQKWRTGFQSLSAVTGFVSDGHTVGFKSQGSNQNALNIVPKDDTAPSNAQIVLFAADGATVKMRLDNDGNMVIQSLQFGTTTANKITKIRSAHWNMTINVPAGGFQNLLLDGSSGQPTIGADVTKDAPTFSVQNPPAGLLWTGYVSGSNIGIRLYNPTGSAITGTYLTGFQCVTHV